MDLETEVIPLRFFCVPGRHIIERAPNLVCYVKQEV